MSNSQQAGHVQAAKQRREAARAEHPDSSPPELGDAGIIVIPSIIGQVAQILIDSVVASRWARQSAGSALTRV